MEQATSPQAEPHKKKGHRALFILLLLLLVGAGVYLLLRYEEYVRSDDASVAGYQVLVSPQMPGRITALYVQEGDTVRKGQLLATLDTSALVAERSELEAEIAQMGAQVAEAEMNMRYSQEAVVLRQLNAKNATDNFNRGKIQYEGGAIPQQAFQELQIAQQAGVAQVTAAQRAVDVARAQIQTVLATQKAVASKLALISTQLSYARVLAPADGVVAKRWLLAGDMLEAGQTIFTLSQLGAYWIASNLEETKVRYAYLGQKVDITLDAYPDKTFEGSIFFIGPVAASQFSLIPPQNASGNFTKVTQRIPLKISVDAVVGGGSLADYPLRPGMSAEIKMREKE